MLGVGIDVPGPAPSLRSVPQDRAQPVHVDEGLTVSVQYLEAAVDLLDLPGRWEAAGCHGSLPRWLPLRDTAPRPFRWSA
jgi:hypothetical protein